MVSGRWKAWWWWWWRLWLCPGGGGGAAGYLESLPEGPNDSDSVLSPGLLLQFPQLPASLLRGRPGRDKRAETKTEGR